MDTVTKSGLPSRRKPPERRGSRKGVPNKVTAELKEMILQALDEAGGVKYLAKQAKEKPAAFLPLLGRVLPLQVSGGLTLTLEEMVKQSMRPDEPGG